MNMSKFSPLHSPSKTCALPFDFALERDPKNIIYYQCDIESYRPGPQFLYLLIDTNTYTLNLPICNSGLAIMLQVYITFSLFFKI